MKNILHRNPKFPERSTSLQLLSLDDLALLRRGIAAIGGGERRPSKMLVKVGVERSSGPVQVVMSVEETVENLIKRVLEIYVAEKQRPFLPETDPHLFELHYSQFCLECLGENEKLINLGSRDFFLCSKRNNMSVSSCCYNNSNNINQLDSSHASFSLRELFLLD